LTKLAHLAGLTKFPLIVQDLSKYYFALYEAMLAFRAALPDLSLAKDTWQY
jgi:hypothetical protein